METINFDDFLKIELVSWTIIKVKNFKEAKTPRYKIWVDFWVIYWEKKTSAAITNYTKEELIWKQVMWVLIFPPKQIWNFISEFLITAFIDKNWNTILSTTDKKIDNWLRLL